MEYQVGTEQFEKWIKAFSGLRFSDERVRKRSRSSMGMKLIDWVNSTSAPVRDYYDETVYHAEQMSVHVEGAIPYSLLEQYRPNEEEAVREYRINSYEPVTVSEAQRAIMIISRIFNPRLYSIDSKDMPYDNMPSLNDYIHNGIPFYGSVIKFARTTMFNRMFADPNGCVYCLPKEWKVGDNYWEPAYYTCAASETLSVKEGDHYLIRKPVKKGLLATDTVYQYLLFTNEEVYRLDDKGKVLAIIEHKMGSLPISRLGGILKGTEEPFYYHSFLSGALPHWNKMVRQVSDRDGSIVNYLHGQAWRLVSDAEANHDMGYEEKGGVDKPVNQSSSPYTEIKVYESAISEKNATIPPYGVIQKDVAIFQELDKMVDKEREEAFDALVLTIVNEAGASQSGIAKAHDRQDVNSMYQVISDHTFGHISNLIRWTAYWRYPVLGKQIEEILPDVNAPQNFEALTMKELTQELNESSMLPKAYKRELMNRITSLRFNSNETERARLRTIQQFDTLATDSIEEILTARQAGIITKEEWYYHEHSEEVVDILIEENPEFLKLGYIEKRNAIDTKVKQLLSDIQASTLDVDVLIDANT